MNIDTPLVSHIPSLMSLWREAFNDTEKFLNAFFSTAFSLERCRCGITQNGEVVAALYWFDCLYMDKRVAYLYAVATAHAYRGQGICHKLMADTLLHLTKLGYAGSILVPGNKELFKLYENMGYQTCSYIREFHCNSMSGEVQLRHIDQTEYATLRRQLLPMGGIVQENENLDFLQTQTKLYTGPGFLLAAYGASNTLYGVELLGDETFAPKIVQALGYTEGIFRTPGKDMPFAMYLSLGDSKLPPPTYLGLAFD